MTWSPDLSRSGKPRYLAIADLIAEDVRSGRLAIGERLPPQRTLANALGIDFTTVARGYVEARNRGLVPAQDRLLVTPGAHAALLGILGILAKPGDIVVCEAITYPGVRSIAAQLGLRLVGLAMDEDGVTPEALDEACERHRPKALYLNPTLQNPTTLTISEPRRAALAEIARLYDLPIVEDDAYGFIPTRKISAFAAIAPDLTWHIAGLAKCIGAGLRAAYVIAPSARAAWPFVAALRTANVMASPLTVAIATAWIEDGTADAILRFIRTETAARQRLAGKILPRGSFVSDPLSFNLWVRLPGPWSRSSFMGHMRDTGIGVVASDAFTAGGPPTEAVRICIGGPSTREEISRALEIVGHALVEGPTKTASYI